MKERVTVIMEEGFMGCVRMSAAGSPANTRLSTRTRVGREMVREFRSARPHAWSCLDLDVERGPVDIG